MSEKPILFNAEMVRAILDGRKTMTRLIIKRQPVLLEPRTSDELTAAWREGFVPVKCPYGAVGDGLWVRETMHGDGDGRWFPAAGGDFDFDYENKIIGDKMEKWCLHQIKKQRLVVPSIHMPRWASRIQLKITDIRVDRLQDITDDDAKKEGCFFTDYGNRCYHPKPCPLPEKHEYHPIKNGWQCYETKSDAECFGSPRMGFANLWNEINTEAGKTWDDNPYVWVVEFEVIKP